MRERGQKVTSAAEEPDSAQPEWIIGVKENYWMPESRTMAQTRTFFRYHLSTTLVTMLVLAVLLGVNLYAFKTTTVPPIRWLDRPNEVWITFTNGWPWAYCETVGATARSTWQTWAMLADALVALSIAGVAAYLCEAWIRLKDRASTSNT